MGRVLKSLLVLEKIKGRPLDQVIARSEKMKGRGLESLLVLDKIIGRVVIALSGTIIGRVLKHCS